MQALDDGGQRVLLAMGSGALSLGIFVAAVVVFRHQTSDRYVDNRKQALLAALRDELRANPELLPAIQGLGKPRSELIRHFLSKYLDGCLYDLQEDVDLIRQARGRAWRWGGALFGCWMALAFAIMLAADSASVHTLRLLLEMFISGVLATACFVWVTWTTSRGRRKAATPNTSDIASAHLAAGQVIVLVEELPPRSGEAHRAMAVSSYLRGKAVPGTEADSLLAEERASLLVCFSPEGERSRSALLQWRKLGRRAVVHLQHQLAYFGEDSGRRILRALAEADGVVVPADFLCADLNAARVLRCRRIRNGAPKRLFFPRSEAAIRIFRERRNIPASVRLLGFSGTVSPAKGVQLLERLLQETEPTTHLAVATWPGGESAECASELAAKFAGRVHLCGSAGGWDGRLLASFVDCLVLPSLSEVAPMVVIEALLSGTPVVATASTPFYQELMLDGILARDLRSVPMPDRVRKQAGPNLRLEQPEIDAIGELLLEAVLGTPPPDSAGRILRSGRALLAGLYEDRMLSELARYYAGVLATGDAPQAADAIRWLQ